MFVSSYLFQTISNQDDHCDGEDSCDAAGVKLRRAAVRLGNASTVAMITGGVVLAGGAVLFFTAPRSPAAPPPTGVGARPPRWSARVEVLPGFVQVGGSWQ